MKAPTECDMNSSRDPGDGDNFGEGRTTFEKPFTEPPHP